MLRPRSWRSSRCSSSCPWPVPPSGAGWAWSSAVGGNARRQSGGRGRPRGKERRPPPVGQSRVAWTSRSAAAGQRPSSCNASPAEEGTPPKDPMRVSALVVPFLLLAPSRAAAQTVTPPFESSLRASAALELPGRRARAPGPTFTVADDVVAPRRRGQQGQGETLMILGGAAVVVGAVAGGGGGAALILWGGGLRR